MGEDDDCVVIVIAIAIVLVVVLVVCGGRGKSRDKPDLLRVIFIAKVVVVKGRESVAG